MAAVQGAAAQHHGRHGQVVIAGGAESISTSPQRDEARCCRHRRAGAVDVAEPPRDARRARVRHVDHRRLEHRREGRRHPRRHGRVGVPLAHARGRGDRRGSPRRRRSSRSKSSCATARRRCSTSTSTRAATARMEKLGEPQAAAPRDRGLQRHRRQLVGPQRRGCRDGARRQRLRGGARPQAARQDRRRGRRSGVQPRDTGLGPIYAIPKALEPRRHDDRRRRPRRDQRGVRVGARRRVPAARAQRGDHERERLAAAPSATRSRPPAPA